MSPLAHALRSGELAPHVTGGRGRFVLEADDQTRLKGSGDSLERLDTGFVLATFDVRDG